MRAKRVSFSTLRRTRHQYRTVSELLVNSDSVFAPKTELPSSRIDHRDNALDTPPVTTFRANRSRYESLDGNATRKFRTQIPNLTYAKYETPTFTSFSRRKPRPSTFPFGLDTSTCIYVFAQESLDRATLTFRDTRTRTKEKNRARARARDRTNLFRRNGFASATGAFSGV